MLVHLHVKNLALIEEAEVVSPSESPAEENLGGKVLKIVHFKWPKFSSGFFSWLRKFSLKKPFSFKKEPLVVKEASSRSKSSQILILVVPRTF